MTKHNFHHTVLREYDIRGIVDDTLHAADALAIGRAYGTMVRAGGGSVVSVGYDGRHSSPTMAAALMQGLTETGLKVLDVGLGPTPMLYYSVFELESDGGIMITGSHNPANYNGFKMMMGQKPFYGDDIQNIGRLAAAGDFTKGDGWVEKIDLFDRYIDRLLQDYNGASFNVAWDTGNGAAGEAVQAVINQLPGEHHLLFGEIDGDFPNHHPDPTVEKNLIDVKAIVKEKGLDIGLAFDGDGDRIGAVDSDGTVIWGDQILAILAEDVLLDVPGAPIIADVKASQAFFDRIDSLGGRAIMWKTGHSLVKVKMAEENSPLAGEMSGHIFFKHKFYGFDDAIYAALRLLNAIERLGGDLKAIRAKLPEAINTPELRFDCDEDRKFQVVEEVRAALEASGANMSTVDGVRVKTDDGWWLLRASNTQAVLVARCESDTEAGLERLKAALSAALEACGVAAPSDM